MKIGKLLLCVTAAFAAAALGPVAVAGEEQDTCLEICWKRAQTCYEACESEEDDALCNQACDEEVEACETACE